MIAEIGHYALVLALFIAVIQGTIPLIGAQKGNETWMLLARPAAIGQFVFVLTAYGALTYAFVVSDFSVVNVWQNSHTAKPLLYKISGVWANHEGSMILWIFILAIFGLAVAVFGRNLPPALRARTLAVQAMISVGFILFILFTSNPFLRLDPAPMRGKGLNPLLQDPGLAFHPPFLYLGYVGFSIAFSFAIAALIEGRVDAAWARWVRPWTLAAWVFLTMGIGLGSWWAYYELGWGGWWYWDPVENASFMPWLAGTALLHSAIVVEKRDALKNWTILLAIVAFSLSLLGTFLVRSGILTSVHAFASDPTRGTFVLGLLAVTVGGSLALYAYRAPNLQGGGLFAPISREGGLLLNNLILSAATATVLLGTLYPLFADALKLGKVSVGPPFFDATFGPLMVPLIAAMAVGPLLSWKRADLAGALSRLKFAFGTAILAAGAAFLSHGGEPKTLLAAGGMALAGWLVGGAVMELAERIKLFRTPLGEALARAGRLPRATYGMTVAHLGLAVLVAGITAVSAWDAEKVQTMKPGDVAEIAGYRFRFDSAAVVPGPNWRAVQGAFTLLDSADQEIAQLFPHKRQYDMPPMPTTEAAIHSALMYDLYAVIGDEAGDGAYVTRFYYKPMVSWLWGGFALLALGGVISLTDRRHRVGAPLKRKAAPATEGAAS